MSDGTLWLQKAEDISHDDEPCSVHTAQVLRSRTTVNIFLFPRAAMFEALIFYEAITIQLYVQNSSEKDRETPVLVSVLFDVPLRHRAVQIP